MKIYKIYKLLFFCIYSDFYLGHFPRPGHVLALEPEHPHPFFPVIVLYNDLKAK